MSTGFTLYVQPQRPTPTSGWVSCLEHQAKRWVVCSERRVASPSGRRTTTITQLACYPSKREAYEDLHRRQSVDKGVLYRLGARMLPPAKRKPPIAESLTITQYLERKGKN